MPDSSAGEKLVFRITDEMVDRFSDLTQDKSSLHIDADFARRSPYRRRVVHGMLPLMYLAAWQPTGFSNDRWRVARLSARFLSPAFVDEELELLVTPELPSDVEGVHLPMLDYQFRVGRVTTGETVTEGIFGLEQAPENLQTGISGAVGKDSGCSLILDELTEQVCALQDLQVGQSTSFALRVDTCHQRGLRELLHIGGGVSSDLDERLANDHALFHAACSSAYVGMCVPGRYATFTAFDATWQEHSSESIDQRFMATVKFLSASTRMTVSEFSVVSDDGTKELCRGEIRARVNDPPAVSPSFRILQEEAADLGIQNRVVLVTGASRGIGATVAKMFAAHGALVGVNYYSGESDADTIVEEIQEAGGSATAIQSDVGDPSSVREMFASVVSRFGPVEILVNNAAGDFFPVDFLNLSWETVERDLDIIVKGAFNCCQMALPAMIERGFGRIVNLSTIAVDDPPGRHASYVLAKSALMGLTRSLAVDHAAHGVQVNMVAPSLVETDLTSHVSKMARDTAKIATPMGRHATTLDVARAVLFLASNLASFTTGQRVAVTGGQPPFL